MDIKLYDSTDVPSKLIGVVGFTKVDDLCDAVTKLEGQLRPNGALMITDQVHVKEARDMCTASEFSKYLESPMKCPDKATLNKLINFQLTTEYLGKTYNVCGEGISGAERGVDVCYYSLPDGTFKFRDKIYKSISDAIKDDSNAYKGNKFGHMKLEKGDYATEHFWDVTLSDFENRYSQEMKIAGVTIGNLIDVNRAINRFKDDYPISINWFKDDYLNLFSVDETHIKFDYEVIHLPDDKDKRTFIRYGLDVLQLRSE